MKILYQHGDHHTIIGLQVCFQKMAADIMSKLFEADLDEVLREIFFNLDSVSIRSSRCGFLRNTIWHFTEAWDKGLKIPQLSQKRGVITFLLLLFHRFAFPQMRLPPMEWIHQATHPSKQVSLLIFVKNGQNYFSINFQMWTEEVRDKTQPPMAQPATGSLIPGDNK